MTGMSVVIRSDRIEDADHSFKQFDTWGATMDAGEYDYETLYGFPDMSQEQAIRQWVANAFLSSLIRGADIVIHAE